MKIAVTSQNFRTITGHAGKARRFLVYETNTQGEVRELTRLDLPKEQSFHEWHGREGEQHPLDIADVLITSGCGTGFKQRLAERGIRLEITSETDPHHAASLFLKDKLPAPDDATPHAHHHHDDDDDHHDHGGHDGHVCDCGAK